MSTAPLPTAGAPAQPVRQVLHYDQLHRLGLHSWWRALLGIAVVGIGVFGLASVVLLLPFGLWLVATGQPLADGLDRLLDLSDPSPATLAYINLSLISAIPLVWFATRVLHGLHIGWASSVFRRLRWKYLLACLVAAFVALTATLAVGAFLPVDNATGMETSLNEFTSTTRDFLLVVVLLTPFQAAAEEYLFRGYLLQVVGGVVGARAFSVIGSAVLFALAHGLGQSWPIFIDRLAFGLVAGTLVVLTGGLEAGIAMHVLNNVVAFGIALAFGDMASALNPTEGSWWMLTTTLTQSLVYLGLAVLLARWMGVSATVSAPVLEPGARPV
ncbi:MAG: lysostaphin resistance A-like protein [Nocardioides sp.]|uniref:CPBP family intramembrane glutamic endopeptidase n=1 Tax=Nocardioides sp. TaxID=35761 RepID=UPI003F0DC29F